MAAVALAPPTLAEEVSSFNAAETSVNEAKTAPVATPRQILPKVQFSPAPAQPAAKQYAVGLDGTTIPSARLEELGDAAPPTFKFEAGPSLYSGLSPDASPNPLKHIYQMVGEEPEWITYDKWGAYLPEAPEGYELSIGAENFLEILRRYGGPTAVADWERLASTLRPLAKGVMGLPSTAVRGDLGLLATLGLKYPGPLLAVLKDSSTILAPFDMESPDSPFRVDDPFLRNYLDLIAFLLQGLPAKRTLAAVMAYMVEDFYREGARGAGGGGNGRAVGVETRKGRIFATEAVVSNADLKNTFDLVDRGVSEAFDEERDRLLKDVPLCKTPAALGAAVVTQIASPLTHARYLNRHRGNYGPAIAAGGDVEFPKVTTPLEGHFRCGDSTTAGIGVPAVASSGAQCANALLSVFAQLDLNAKIRM
ncbi:all-trans-retinol 13,14-reductase [Aureococcus anophagefferens]|nr:all-trans-retinol 13,14-reductase [Aureococcus anophagefferens]